MKKKKKILIFVIFGLTALSALSVFAFKKEKTEEYETVKVEARDLIQTVSEVGAVKAISEINLGFLGGGRLLNKYAEIGDQIKEGQVLAELDYSGLLIQREEAQSNLDVARASLNKLLSGATAGEIAISEAMSEKARVAYLASLNNLEKVEKAVAENISQTIKTLGDLESDDPGSVTSYEQAVSSARVELENTKAVYQKDINNYIDSALSIIKAKLALSNTSLDSINKITSNVGITDQLGAKNKAYLTETAKSYNEAVILFAKAKNSLAEAVTDKSKTKLDMAIGDSLSCLNKVFYSLDYCYKTLEVSTISETDLNSYKASINTELTTVGASVSAVLTAEQNLKNARLIYNTKVLTAEDGLKQAEVSLTAAILSAKNALASARVSGDEKISSAKNASDSSKEAWEIAKKESANLKAPARMEDVSFNRAKVGQAQASLNLINNKIEDSILKSPIDGKIVKDEYRVGEQALAGKTAFSILGENNFEVEADVSESDIAKIKEGDQAKITIDAFGDEVEFLGKVYFIEPAETVISEVIYYKVKIRFDGEEADLENIKSGMTANITITAQERKGVLTIPSRAIVERTNGDRRVRILKDGLATDVLIKTGLRGDGGLVEVLAGIKEGDEVIVSVKK